MHVEQKKSTDTRRVFKPRRMYFKEFYIVNDALFFLSPFPSPFFHHTFLFQFLSNFLPFSPPKKYIGGCHSRVILIESLSLSNSPCALNVKNVLRIAFLAFKFRIFRVFLTFSCTQHSDFPFVKVQRR